MFSTYGSGQAISGQPHSVSWGRLFKPSTGNRGVVFCPGHLGTALSYLTNDAVTAAMTKALAEVGIPVASLPHGANWGNSTAQGYVGNIRAYGQTNWGFSAGTVDLIGGSAGAALALNWAKANPTLVRRIALFIPAVDLQDIHANDRGGYASSIATAWGGGAPADANNPADNAASFTGVPIKCWYSTDDPICVPAAVTAFCTAAGATAVSLGAQGHAITGLNVADVVSFFQS